MPGWHWGEPGSPRGGGFDFHDIARLTFQHERIYGGWQGNFNYDEKILIAEEDAAIFLRNTGDRAAAGPAGAHAGTAVSPGAASSLSALPSPRMANRYLEKQPARLSLTNDRGGK